jgi:hypothetical protein
MQKEKKAMPSNSNDGVVGLMLLQVRGEREQDGVFANDLSPANTIRSTPLFMSLITRTSLRVRIRRHCSGVCGGARAHVGGQRRRQ